MLAVVAWAWSPAGDGRGDAGRIREQLAANWTIVLDRPGLTVAIGVEGNCRWQLEPLEAFDGILVGQLFDRAATERGEIALASCRSWSAASLDELATDLVDRVWGRYLLIARDRDGSLTVLRDPLGACDCVTWCVGAVRIVASQVPPELAALVPRDIDWSRVSSLIAAPATAGDALALASVETLPAGTLSRFGAQPGHRVVWQPANFCSPRSPRRAADPGRLSAIVDACTAAWCEIYATRVSELSGGLDSAIVAAALTASAAGARLRVLNFYTTAAAGDERVYARAVAEQLGLRCEFLERSGSSLDRADFEAVAMAFRPAINAIDLHYDRAMATAARAASAGAIFTGQGGDAVFFQMPTPLVAAERHLDDHIQMARWTVLRRAARWTRSSVWATAWQAGLGRRTALRVTPPIPGFLRETTAIPEHPWLATATNVAPAKRLQIAGLANSCVYFGASWRSRAADVIHPLLSQPIVEHVLAVPVLGLTKATADRQLARCAYSDRLPAAVIGRHGKGDLTGYYGRLIARSGWLRDYLCNGVLAANGVIDADVLSDLLQPDRLAVEDQYTEILATTVVESWLRNWI